MRLRADFLITALLVDTIFFRVIAPFVAFTVLVAVAFRCVVVAAVAVTLLAPGRLEFREWEAVDQLAVDRAHRLDRDG